MDDKDPEAFLRLEPASPFRPVDWRWQVANRHVRGELVYPHSIDRWVRRACRIISARNSCGQPQGVEQPARRCPSWVQAIQLYTQPACFQRWEIEARLLASEGLAAIATKTNTSAKVVLIFERLFFNVRSRIKRTSYVRHFAIGPKAVTGLTEQDVDVLLKMIGYSHGIDALDDAVRYFQEPFFIPERIEQLDPVALQELRSKLAIKTAILIRTLPDVPANLTKLHALCEAYAFLCDTRTATSAKISALRLELTRALGEALIPSDCADDRHSPPLIKLDMARSPGPVGQDVRLPVSVSA